MSNLHEIEFWVAINEEGEFVINVDGASDATCELEGNSHNEAIRVMHFKFNVPLPKVVEVQATIPETDGPVNVTVTS